MTLKRFIQAVSLIGLLGCEAEVYDLNSAKPIEPQPKVFECGENLGDIIYNSREGSSPRTIKAINGDGNGERVIIGGEESHSAFLLTEDGCGLLYLQRSAIGARLGVANSDGSNPRIITNPIEFEGVDLSSDGRFVSFDSIWYAPGCEEAHDESCLQADVYLVDLLQDNTERIADGISAVPKFSPDGKFLAHLKAERENKAFSSIDLMLYDIQKKESRPLTPGLMIDEGFVWLPNNSGLVYVSSSDMQGHLADEIHIDDLQGGKVEIPTNGQSRITSISPNGKYLTFRFYNPVSNVHGLHMLDLETFDITKITPKDSLSSMPSWSADSSQIVFSSQVPDDLQYATEEELEAHITPQSLFVYEVLSKSLRQITHSEPGKIDGSFNARFSADGTIVYASRPNSFAKSDIFTINPYGTGKRQLTTNPGYEGNPQWLPK